MYYADGSPVDEPVELRQSNIYYGEEIEPSVEESVDFQDPSDMDEATINAGQARRRQPRGQRMQQV